MIKIQVDSSDYETKSGHSQKTGKPYSIREQMAWGFFCDADGKPQQYPQRIRLTLNDADTPYQPGMYTLAPESFYPDRFGQISVRARLRPIAASSAAKAA